MRTIDELLNSLFNHEEIKQKQFIKLQTKRCEIYGNTTYNCFGTIFRLPEKLQMKFTLTNDHIERDDQILDKRYKYKPYKINLNFNLN